MKKINFLVFLLLLLFTGCKSAKTVVGKGVLENSMTSEKIIKSHKNNLINFKTLQARVTVEYVKGSKSQTQTVNLRVQKNKIIWINAKLSIIRIKITPQRVTYYNKLDNTYFEGDFSLISEILGVEVTFENIQNLLLGQTLFALENTNFEIETTANSYVLRPNDENSIFKVVYLLNPYHFLLDSQQVSQPLEQRTLNIEYNDYQDVKRHVLPNHIKITAIEKNDETVINMELKSVSLDQELRFPFRIPSGFQKIEIN